MRPRAEPAPRQAPPPNKPRRKPRAAEPNPPEVDARAIADACESLDALKAALEAFDRHPLHAAARTTVFARGARAAPVMVVGEAPGREEDLQGVPFVGRSGLLMDKMFGAAGLTDAAELYISNILNWRPPGNRNPSLEEIALSMPFIERHIALKAPKVLVVAGGVAAKALMRTDDGIMRLRGRWASYHLKTPGGGQGPEIPVLPVYHPAFILRRPIAKREAWADMLALADKLEELGLAP